MKKILFVEDDAVVTRIYTRKLEEAGFGIVVAEDGLAAMRILSTYRPDLVVLDILLPKFNGLDVLKFMRGHAELNAVPVVVFSNALLTELGEKVNALGVQALVPKSSANPAVVLESIEKIFQPPAAPSVPPVTRWSAYTAAQAAAQGKPEPELAPAPAPAPAESAAIPAQVERHFFSQLPAICDSLKKLAQEFTEATTPSDQFRRIETLRKKINFVTHMAGMAGCRRIAQLSDSLEALLFKLQENTSDLNDSSRRTAADAIAFLTESLAHARAGDERDQTPMSILIVDDDAVSNLALTLALRRANAGATTAADGMAALQELVRSAFDVVIFDVDLPGMTGIELCEKMRELPRYQDTPVIFITGYPESKGLAASVLRPTDDWITKPVLPVELAVKVIVYAMKRRGNL